MSNEIENNVNDALSTMQIKFNASYIGPDNKDNWKCNKWRVSFIKYDSSYYINGEPKYIKSESFDYFMGLGHVIKSKVSYVPDKPKAPNACEVLHCLILDGALSDNSFDEFCGNLGYDEDSRKALETYLQCQNQYKQLKNVFSSSDLSLIEELTQDY